MLSCHLTPAESRRELSSSNIRMNIKTRIVRLLVVLNKKLKLRNISRNKSSDTDSSGESSDVQEYANFSFREEEAPLKTSTPMKQNQTYFSRPTSLAS